MFLRRKTRQKEAIRQAFVRAGRPLSPHEVLAFAAETVAGLSISTVYRSLAALVEDRWLASVAIPGMATRYEVAGQTPHHHFHCSACDKLFDVPGSDVDLQPTVPKGYTVTGQEFFLYGMCGECR